MFFTNNTNLIHLEAKHRTQRLCPSVHVVVPPFLFMFPFLFRIFETSDRENTTTWIEACGVSRNSVEGRSKPFWPCPGLQYLVPVVWVCFSKLETSSGGCKLLKSRTSPPFKLLGPGAWPCANIKFIFALKFALKYFWPTFECFVFWFFQRNVPDLVSLKATPDCIPIALMIGRVIHAVGVDKTPTSNT